MIEGWAEVISVRASAVPCPAVVGRLVDNDAAARRSEGGSVEIERAVKVVVRGDFWVGAGLTEHV